MYDMDDDAWNFPAVDRLTKDLRASAKLIGRDEARYLVDAYYTQQRNRIRSANQARALVKDHAVEEPAALVSWMAEQNASLEEYTRLALKTYAENHKIGHWLTAVHGVGPVISAGLLAHIDIHKCPTYGHILSFAGLAGDTQRPWLKGEKRPYNATLKTLLAFKLGECFVKVSGNEKAFYGRYYRMKKDELIAANERGDFAEKAAKVLASRNFRGDTVAKACYEAGKYPPAHIHALARRKTVALFVAHLWEVWRKAEGLDICKPYAIEHLGHAHIIPVPYMD